jgi:ABC-type transport system substrate-binding protein
LTQLGPKVEPVPALATGWRNTTPTTWTIDLRQGVTFSNGEPFDAAAAVAIFDYLKSPAAVQESSSRDVENIVGVRALASHAIEITTRTPDPTLPRQLTTVAMVAPAAWKSLGRDAFAFKPVGTGPFAVESWGEARIALKAFAGSWRPPKSERLEILTLPETSTRIAALMSEQVHLASEVGPEDLDLLKESGFTIYQRPSTSIEVIALHAKAGTPLGDVRVRQALNLAIDHRGITEALLHGLVEPPTQMAPRSNPDYNPSLKTFDHDPARAKALLAEAGYANGVKFTMVMSAGTGGGHMRATFEKVAADLAAIGVTMTIRPVPWSQFVRGVLQGEWLGEAFGFEYETLPTGDVLRPFRLHSCSWPHPWYCDPETEPLIAAAKAEFDPARRRGLAHTILANYREKAAAILLFEQIGLDAVSPHLEGYDQTNGIIPFQDLLVTE